MLGTLKFDSKNPKYTSNGYLIADAIVAKVGVVERLDPVTGELRKEFISEESLFSKSSLESLFCTPVTLYHPYLNQKRTMLTPENTQLFQKGVSFGQPEKYTSNSEIYLKVPVIFTDKDLMNKILDGSHLEVSLGYVVEKADIKKSGSYKGTSYNYVQGSRKNNHIAIEKNGFNRGGRDITVQLKFDSVGQNEIFYYQEQKNIKNKEKGVKKVALVIDGQTVELEKADEIVVGNKIKEDSKTITKLEAENKALSQKVDLLQGKFDGLSEENKTLQKLKQEKDEEEKKVFISSTKEVLGNDFKFDGLSTVEIKKAVISKINPNLDLKEKSEAYINGVFDSVNISQKAPETSQRFDSNSNEELTKRLLATSQQTHIPNVGNGFKTDPMDDFFNKFNKRG